MATPTARTVRLAPEERRRQLLDAALALLATEGFDAVTVEAIARRAGVTRPVVYDQFGDLDGLLLALVEREEQAALAPLLAIVGGDPGDVEPDAFLVDGVGRFLAAVRDAPLTWRLVLIPPDGGSPDLRARVQRSRRRITDRVAALLAWGLERRGGPAGLDTDLLARLLVAAGEDAARLVLTDPARHAPERLAGMARALLALVPPDGRVPAAPPGGARGAPAGGRPIAPATPVPPAPRPGARVPRADRRRQLLDVTLTLLAEEGFDALNVEAVARRAGVNRVVVYRSFGGLHALLLTLLRREQARVRRALDALVPEDPGDRSPGGLLADALEDFLRVVTAEPRTWRVALQRPESAPKLLRGLILEERAQLAARLRPLVAWGVEDLDADLGDVDLDLLARLLLTVGEEHGRVALEDPDFTVERLAGASRRFLAVLPWRTPPGPAPAPSP